MLHARGYGRQTVTTGGTQEKALADEFDEQRCQEEAACTAALAEMALAKE
jgi:hypothetical protein